MRRPSFQLQCACSLVAVVSLASLACHAPGETTIGVSATAAPSAGGSGNSTTGGGSAGQINLGSANAGGQLALFDGQVERSPAALPIAGGTLLVTRDGATAIAADPERDQVFLVDLASRAVRAVRVEPRDEPGRVAEGPHGLAYVLARRGGAMLVIDLALGAIDRRVPVCAAPRGVAFDAAANTIHVACRSGRLVTLDANTFAPTRTLELDSDLRDVLVRGSELVLTRFRSAELLVLDAEGKVLRRSAPSPQPGCATASVAYRAVLDQDGDVLIAHQSSSDDTVGVSAGAYGASCGGALVNAFLTVAAPDKPEPTPLAAGSVQDPVDFQPSPIASLSAQVVNATGPLDVAVSSTGRFAVLANASAATGPASLSLGTLEHDATGLPIFSVEGLSPVKTAAEPVAVAFDATGNYIVQSRQPAQLSFADGSTLSLSAEGRADTGQAMFHLTTGAGVACASCHPEGDEDGHLWHFTFGLRRTQPLQGGVLSRAPFHWTGELAEMSDLVSEVMIKRMALQQLPSPEQVNALGSWLDSLELEPSTDNLDVAAVSRGAQVFRDPAVGCSTCHVGPQLTDNQLHDVGTGGPFSTPTLLGVGLRSPLFHDGCAQSLAARFGACGGGERHGSTSQLSAQQLGDLLVYLKSL